jgi:hypothetical protein
MLDLRDRGALNFATFLGLPFSGPPEYSRQRRGVSGCF